jgi:hypothetical protein
MQATSERAKARALRLLPTDQTPRYLRCYDNGGKTIDRYTIVFTGRYRHKTGGAQWYVGSSAYPTHPQGFYQHGEHTGWSVDRPTYSHLGKRVRFADLPGAVRRCVLSDYRYLWDLPAPLTPRAEGS